jgi:sugar-phosphatase
VVFEDAPAGCAAGKAAGCVVIATLFSHTREQLAAADYLVESIDGVEVSGAAGALEIVFEPV